MSFNDCARDNGNGKLFCKGLVFLEVRLPLIALGEPGWILGKPVIQVIFRQESEVGAARGSGTDELTGFGIVLFDC